MRKVSLKIKREDKGSEREQIAREACPSRWLCGYQFWSPEQRSGMLCPWVSSAVHLRMREQREDFWEWMYRMPLYILGPGWHWFLCPNKNTCSKSSLNFIPVFIFNYVYGSVGLCTWIQVSRRPEVGVGCPDAGLQAVVSHLMWVWKLNSNPLQEHYTILTTDR